WVTWTAVLTRCVRPDRARRKSAAWRRSLGFPKIRPSSTTSVSAATTMAPRTRLATASAFASAAHNTKRIGPSGRGGRSSTPGATMRNHTPARRKMSTRRADDDASTRRNGGVVTRSQTEHPQEHGWRDAAGPGENRADPAEGTGSLGSGCQRVPVEQWRELQQG